MPVPASSPSHARATSNISPLPHHPGPCLTRPSCPPCNIQSSLSRGSLTSSRGKVQTLPLAPTPPGPPRPASPPDGPAPALRSVSPGPISDAPPSVGMLPLPACTTCRNKLAWYMAAANSSLDCLCRPLSSEQPGALFQIQIRSFQLPTFYRFPDALRV